MSARGIRPGEAPQWVERAVARKKAHLLNAMEAAGRRTVVHLQTEVIAQAQPHPPVDRGLFRAGWHLHRHARGIVIYNITPGNYGPIIDRGARAANIKVGRKMIDALAGWAKRKGLNPDGPGERLRGKRRPGVEAYRGVAWAIAMRMKKRGIFNGGKGLRILEKAALAFPRFLHDEIRSMRRG